MRHIYLLIIMLSTACIGLSQEIARPVTSTWMAGFGTAHLSDAYLAPYPTTGWGATLMYERAQALKSRPHQWSRLLGLNLDMSRTHTRGTISSGIIWSGSLTAEMGALRRFAPLPCGLKLALGPSMEVKAGANYRPSNGNNPVAAHAAITLGLTGRATYPLRLGRLPAEVALRPSLQLVGAFFGPAFGELYYEIYEGNHSGLAHIAWPGNRLAYSQLLSIDLRLGSTSLRLGYSMKLSTQEAHGLATNSTRHMAVIGITSDFLSLTRRSTTPLSSLIEYAF
ncbi:MAG: DUF3316 domain-containing protein [Pseudoflavonifractor sp.]|nr:DUF3316 domain-containing protein [Alloprevotella sp.]MCM1117480.1 DUF3316 domain-containing protein [Pseudoflavonifractor sp.]